MKRLSLLSGIVLFSSYLMAQSYTARCGAAELIQAREQAAPGYIQRVDACFRQAKQIAQQQQNNRSAQDTIYRIRCVFHIVYTNAAENIPDSVIYSQIEVLNEDYRRRNADTVKTRAIFHDVAADAGIEFYLATTDPDGNPTTGITRTQGTPGFLGFEPFTDGVKSTAAGGIDPWPTDRYLNIWVCNILNGMGVLGYAFPPSNAPNWDSTSLATDSAKQGVVLHYPVVGRNFANPIDPTVTKGRSAVHEIGHYLGLRHIWGDGDCSVDDGIDDTPNANAAHQQTCDTSSNTCVDQPIDFPDMIENYMDYSDDRCLNMFTREQVGIMRAMLQTSRAGVATSFIPTGLHDLPSAIHTVQVFPNPSAGTFALRVALNTTEPYTVELFNTLGVKIESRTNIPAENEEQIIRLNNQPTGIYLVKVTCGTQSLVKKIQLTR